MKFVKLRHGALVGLEVIQWDGVGDQVNSLDDMQNKFQEMLEAMNKPEQENAIE